MPLPRLLIIFLLPAAVCCGANSTLLSRKRRYLAFPDKSNLMITITLLKATAFMNGVNTLHEIDFLVPLPKSPHSLIRRNADVTRQHSDREREVLLGQLESAMDMFGLDGALCLERIICEMRNLREEAAKTLVLEVLSRFLSLQDSGTDELDSCTNGCPFSIFHENILKP